MSSDTIIRELENLPKPPGKKRWVLLQIMLAIAALACAFALSKYYLDTAPKAISKKRRIIPPLIEVVSAKFSDVDYRLKARGTVIANKAIELKPRVQGELVSVHSSFTPGGFFAPEEIIATIEREDYDLVLTQLQGEEAKAQAELNLERGRQLVAEKEFELLGQKVSTKERELMLRAPQLKAAQAALQAVRAKKKKAEIDLANTLVRAPFHAVVISKTADLGSRVTPATTMAHLVDADIFLIRITIPQQNLRWLSIDADNPSIVDIYQNGEYSHSGTLTHIASDLEEGSNMAKVYAAVTDPLSRTPENAGQPQLLLGSFVQVEITGRKLTNVLTVKRENIDGENTIWILNEDGYPAPQKVEIIARDNEYVYIRAGIDEGASVIVSKLPSVNR